MPHGGQLTLETANVELDTSMPGCTWGATRVHTSCSPSATPASEWIADPGAHLRAVLHHQGPAQGHRPRPRHGSMASSSRAAGNIGVYSEPGRERPSRSIFRRSTSRSTRAPRAPPVPSPSYGKETVLVVEDEEGVRALVRDILEQSGYTVLEASHGLRRSRPRSGTGTDSSLPHRRGHA
jgi:hypothetical protein